MCSIYCNSLSPAISLEQRACIVDTALVSLSDVFSYKSRFSFQTDSRWTFIWRAPGTRYHQKNRIERHRFVWGRIVRRGHYSGFQNCPACSDGNHDRPNVLGRHSGTTCTLVAGHQKLRICVYGCNARPHHENIVKECLQSENNTIWTGPHSHPT
ncbi:DDE_3 domain-containing protein [Trichonephila clavipes]|nr:DDE_3 domain-containing protein [Trichonephila clavipes]